MFEGFLAFGGTEIANAARTAAYVDHMLPNFGLDNCYDCGDLQHALGHEDYTSPLVDGADWFDQDDVNSQTFFGMYPLSVEGVDDAVRESTVTQLAGDGAVMSAPRQKGREIRVVGLLIGKDDAAVQYGLTWLRRALFGGVCRDSTSCTGDHLCYFSSCPPICEDSPDVVHPEGTEAMPAIHNQRLCDEGLISTIARACALPYERNLYEVTVIDGPRVVERYNTVCGSMVRVEFTMVAGVPWSYSTASWVASSDEGQISQTISEISCIPGTTAILRRNLAINPVPMTTGGWTAGDPTAYTVTRDTTFSRLPSRTSAKVTITNAEALANVATNPIPTGNLTGWGYDLGSADPTVRTNLALNPRPYPQGGGWTFSAGAADTGGRNLFPNPSIVDGLTGWNHVSWGPVQPADRTNLVTNPRAIAPTYGAAPTAWRSSEGSTTYTRTNLMRQPSPSGTDFWTGTATGTATTWSANYTPLGAAADPFRSGMRRELTTVGTASFLTAIADTPAARIPVTPGQTYTASIALKYTHTPSGRASQYVIWRDAAGAQIGPADIPFRDLGPVNTWDRLVQEFLAPAGAATMSVGVSVGSVEGWPVGAYIQFAYAMVTTDGTSDFIDGWGIPGAWETPGWNFAWTGVTGQSVSTATTYFGGALAADPDAGAVVRQVVANSSLYVDPNVNFPVAVGDKISFQAEVMSDVGQVAGALRLQLGVYNGAALSDIVSTPRGAPVGVWTPMSVTATVATAPAGAYVRTLIDGQTSKVGDGFFFRRTIVEIGPGVAPLGPYFDGTTPDSASPPLRYYEWTGAADASTSVSGPGTVPSGTVTHSATGGMFQSQQDSGVMTMTWSGQAPVDTDIEVVRWDPVTVTGAGSANNMPVYVAVRTSAPNLTMRAFVRLEELNGSTVVQTKDGSYANLGSGQWFRTGTFLTPTTAGNTLRARLFVAGINGNAIPTGTEFEVSNLSLGDAGVGQPATYWDGDTPNYDTAITYAWTGTARASSSTKTVLAPAGTSALQTGIGPNGLAGYYRRTVTVPETSPNAGAYWQYLTPSVPPITWAVGDRATASVYVLSSYPRQLALRATVTGRSSTTTGTLTTVPANVWTRLSVTVPITSAGSGTINVQTNYPNAQSEQSGTFDITQLLIEKSASVLSYFDGGMTDTATLDFAWTSTVNGSTSTLSNKPPTATTSLQTGVGPNAINGFQRTTITVPKTAGYSGAWYQLTDAASTVYTGAMWVRFSVATNARLIVQGRNAGGSVIVSADSPFHGIAANTWTRLGPETIEAPGIASVRVWVQQDPSTVLPIGATMDVAQVVIARAATLGSPSMGRVTYVGQSTTTNTLALMPTVEYTASVYVATSRPSNARVLLAFRNSAGTVISTLTGAWEPTSALTWNRVDVTGVAPAGTAYGTIETQASLLDHEAQVGDVTWWGDVLLERSSVALAYFDGSLPDTGSIDYAWTGTANNSISTLSRTIPLDPGPLLDPDCAVIPQAPRPPILDIACLDTPTSWRRFTAIVPDDVVPMWRDAVPIVRVATDSAAVRQVRVRFYPNPFLLPVEALDPCDYCGEFVISYIPPNSIMTIDGIRRVATVSGPTGTVQVASHLLYASDGGPMVWPELTCGIAYTVTLDVSPEGVTGLSAEICAAARE